MRGKRDRKESGMVVVEATVIFPIAILSVILLLYLSLIMFQKANLQAGLETTLVYYKNTVTDTYVTQNDELSGPDEDNNGIASGNSYSVTGPKSPYENFLGDGNKLNDVEAFEKYFRSVAGNMLFDDNLTFTIDYNNYVLLKQFKATAVQVIEFPIDFSAIGVSNKYVIVATARVNVTDHDDMIRNLDYAVDIVEDTKFGEFVKNYASKAAELYGKMKKFLYDE